MVPAVVKTVPWWVKTLVAFHAFAIIVWTMPNAPAQPRGTDWVLVFDQKLKQSNLRYYLICTGFWQYWDMFAPNPANNDIWCDAEVTFQSGVKRIHQYPRMKKLSIPEKYLKERYRKFYERASMGLNSYLWPPFAQRIALEAYTRPDDPPVEVRLRIHERIIKPPDQPQETGFTTTEYYRHIVDLKKLRADAGR